MALQHFRSNNVLPLFVIYMVVAFALQISSKSALPQFVVPQAMMRAVSEASPRLVRNSAIARQAGPLEVIREPLQQVVDISLAVNPALRTFPKEVLVWLHPVSQGLVFLPFLYGALLGVQILVDKGDEEVTVPAPIGSGSTSIRKAHPAYMKFASLTFALFAVGGLINKAALGKNILDSDHAVTAGIGLLLLAAQAASSLLMGVSFVRIAHALTGTVTIFVLLAHASAGFNLGMQL